MNIEKEGYYYLHSKKSKEDKVLVHVYRCTDLNNKLSIGFNTHDGGGVMPIEDLTEDSILTEVQIIEKAKGVNMFKTVIDEVIVCSDPQTGKLLRLEKMVNSDDLPEFLSWVRMTLKATIRRMHQLPVESIMSSFTYWCRENGELGAMVRFDISDFEIKYSFGKLDFNLSDAHPDNGYFIYDTRGKIIFAKESENEKKELSERI